MLQSYNQIVISENADFHTKMPNSKLVFILYLKYYSVFSFIDLPFLGVFK